jgi:hypothetical protein
MKDPRAVRQYIWSRVPWGLGQRVTVLARTISNLEVEVEVSVSQWGTVSWLLSESIRELLMFSRVLLLLGREEFGYPEGRATSTFGSRYQEWLVKIQ